MLFTVAGLIALTVTAIAATATPETMSPHFDGKLDVSAEFVNVGAPPQGTVRCQAAVGADLVRTTESQRFRQ